MRWRRALRLLLFGSLGLLVLIQFVPYGRDHANPPVTAEPAWDAPRTRTLAAESCFDCHSNQTEWPWYTNVAPLSWLIQRDVDGGRETLNFTEWDRPQPEADELFEVVAEGSMPPRSYLVTHPGARLTDAERRALLDGLRATFRVSPPIQGEGEPEDE
ncbi:MAG TPA: heme-binding domain-containing protein [Actinomycetota bacterium]|nr:heme-binding domain-containing protein [Actinomycetota bacterium]